MTRMIRATLARVESPSSRDRDENKNAMNDTPLLVELFQKKLGEPISLYVDSWRLRSRLNTHTANMHQSAIAAIRHATKILRVPPMPPL